MGAPFSDITLYTPTPHIVGTPEYIEDTSLENFVSDLYVQTMNGYKPPKTSRIIIQPAFHKIWGRTWKNGSLVTIAPFFSYEEYSSFDKPGRYKYILDLIQTATIQLSEEYQWDKEVFEIAYKKTLENNFQFKIEFPPKQSRDKKKIGVFIIKKNETVTSGYIDIHINGIIKTIKLFDKKNDWWYDFAYDLARQAKWFDNDRFGLGYGKGQIEIWYSITKHKVELYEHAQAVTEIDFSNHFLFK